MNKQAFVMVFLLGVYLGRVLPNPSQETQELTTVIVVFYFVALIVWAVTKSIKEKFTDYINTRHNKKVREIDDEITRICTEIERFSKLKLSMEGVPQYFSTKDDAVLFAETWSYGDDMSYTVKSVDLNGYSERHPKFDATTINGAILFIYPALFFGMKEILVNDEKWWIEFKVAKRIWLQNYLTYLKES